MIFSLQNLSQNNARTRILRFTVFLLVLSLGAQPVVSYAQSSEKKPDGGLFSGKGGLSNDQMGAMFDVGRVGKSGYDAVIGSGRYIVGPGDTFTILVDSGETPEVFEVLIGAEGKLVLPYIGAVPVAGLSLAQAHEAIRNAIQNRFRQLDIHITLSRLRSFPVNVIGEVQAPGTYLVEGVEQVSELIQKAGGFTAPPEGRASLRNIQILRTGENGQTQTADRKADLALWRLSGDIQHNPFILDGDQIYVPVRTDSFSVSGAVQLPGTYEFVPGDRVWDLIQLGGGLAGNPEISTAKLLRPSRNNMPEKRVPIDLALAQTGDPVANFELQANDKLYIEGKEKHVLLQGEVYFPGAYSIGKGLTLEELIVKAGGFTPQASLAQSSVIRQVEFAGAADRPRQLQNIAPGSLTEAQRTYLAMKSQQVAGRLPIDFVALFRKGDKSQSISLREDDIVRVPRLVNSILIKGFVIIPGAVPFDPAYAVDDYIERAGGFNEQAKKNEIYVIEASTGNWVKASKIQRIHPGDTIFVEGKKPVYGWRIFRETLVVLTQIATLVIAVRSIR